MGCSPTGCRIIIFSPNQIKRLSSLIVDNREIIGNQSQFGDLVDHFGKVNLNHIPLPACGDSHLQLRAWNQDLACNAHLPTDNCFLQICVDFLEEVVKLCFLMIFENREMRARIYLFIYYEQNVVVM